jgi:hypothetical protein
VISRVSSISLLAWKTQYPTRQRPREHLFFRVSITSQSNSFDRHRQWEIPNRPAAFRVDGIQVELPCAARWNAVLPWNHLPSQRERGCIGSPQNDSIVVEGHAFNFDRLEGRTSEQSAAAGCDRVSIRYGKLENSWCENIVALERFCWEQNELLWVCDAARVATRETQEDSKNRKKRNKTFVHIYLPLRSGSKYLVFQF